MSAQILDPSIFAARINLWVEDEVTRVTLAEYWQDIDIRVSSAAGSTGVKHLTAASQLPAGGANIVVGVIDRDFGTDNQAISSRRVVFLDGRKFMPNPGCTCTGCACSRMRGRA